MRIPALQVVVAFPDEGAWKRFYKSLGEYETVSRFLPCLATPLLCEDDQGPTYTCPRCSVWRRQLVMVLHWPSPCKP